jgi:hypothetical protein
MNTERPRHYFGFNCTVCETFVMTENDEWACLCPRCYHHQQPDLENWLRDGRFAFVRNPGAGIELDLANEAAIDSSNSAVTEGSNPAAYVTKPSAVSKDNIF